MMLAMLPGTAAALVLCFPLQLGLLRVIGWFCWAAASVLHRDAPEPVTRSVPTWALVLAVGVVFFLATCPSELARRRILVLQPARAAAAGRHPAHWSRGCCCPVPGGLLPWAVIRKLLLVLHSSWFP